MEVFEMKVLLINPPSAFMPTAKGAGWAFPLGLLSITGPTQTVAEVEIIDLYIQPASTEVAINSVIEKVAKTKMQDEVVLGISCHMDTFLFVRQLVSEIWARWKNILIVAGGPFATVAPELYLEHAEIHFVVSGEGEITFPELLKCWQNFWEPMNKVAGTVVKGLQTEEIIFNPTRPPIIDLDQWGISSYHLFDVEKYMGSERSLAIATTRGCPFSCTFCKQNYLGPYRERGISKVIEEIQFLKDHYGLRHIHFADATFGVHKKRTMELCEKLASLTLMWDCMARVDKLDQELLESMTQAGCKQIRIGLESATQEIFDSSAKKTSVSQGLEAIDLIQQAGIEPWAFIVLGLPWETEETLQATMSFVKRLNVRITPNTLYPIPGTPLFEEAQKQGKIKSLVNLMEGFAKYNVVGRETSGINLSQVSDEKIAEAVREIWRHNKEV